MGIKGDKLLLVVKALLERKEWEKFLLVVEGNEGNKLLLVRERREISFC